MKIFTEPFSINNNELNTREDFNKLPVGSLLAQLDDPEDGESLCYIWVKVSSLKYVYIAYPESPDNTWGGDPLEYTDCLTLLPPPAQMYMPGRIKRILLSALHDEGYFKDALTPERRLKIQSCIEDFFNKKLIPKKLVLVPRLV